MRFYIPATVTDLGNPDLPTQGMIEFIEPPNVSSEENEVAGEQVLYEAAFASLNLVYNLDAFPARVVIVATGESSKLDWSNVEAIHVDGKAAQDLISRLQCVESQSEADDLVSQIDDEPLEWFAPEEKQQILSTCHTHDTSATG